MRLVFVIYALVLISPLSCFAETELETAIRLLREESQRQATATKDREQDIDLVTKPIVNPNKLHWSNLDAVWAEKLKFHVRARVVVPSEDLILMKEHNPKVSYQIELADTGDVVGVRLLTTSGNKQWDNIVLKAIAMSSPFPKKGDETVEKKIRIDFRQFPQPDK
jgi:TonB family protein